MHHNEIAASILGILAAVLVPAMYWIGRGRDPLGVRRKAETADENGKGSKMNYGLEQSSKEDKQEDCAQKRSPVEPEPIGTKEGPDSPNQ
jgi:hypothetical protein